MRRTARGRIPYPFQSAAAGLLAVLVAAGCTRRGEPVDATAATPVLRVATSGDYSPFSIETDGTAAGMDVDVARRLGRDLGLRVELVPLSWPELLAAAQRGDFDVAMSGVTMRADRALVARYSRPYARVGTMVLVRAADAARFSSIAALDQPGVRIAVNAGGHLERVARARFPHATIEAVADNRAVPRRLLDGAADAAVTDTAELRAWLRPEFRIIGPFTVDYKAYLLPADRPELATRLDGWLVAREADGWMNGERVRWLGLDASMDAAAAGRGAVAGLIRVRLDLMPSVAAAKRAAGLPIDDPAQEQHVIERVRGLSSQPQKTEAVYRQLIEMAKAVQRAAPSPDAAAELGQLRDAIGRVDVQLVRELDRAPGSSVEVWEATLTPSVMGPGIDAAAVEQLSVVLAGSSG